MAVQPVPTPNTTSNTYFDPTINKVVRDLTDRAANVPIVQSEIYSVVEDDEEGFLIAFSITVDDPHVIMEVVAYGDDSVTPIIINNLTMEQILRLGWGLTPGDVEVQPDGDSQDKTGDRDTAYPWLVRYKIDSQEDIFGETNNVITLKYTPSLFHHYRRLVINVKNASTAGEVANIIYLSVIRRIVYERDPPVGVAPRAANRGQFSNVDMEVGSLGEFEEGRLASDFDYGEGGSEVAGGIKAGDVNRDYKQLAPDPQGEEEVNVEAEGTTTESEQGKETQTEDETVTYHEAN